MKTTLAGYLLAAADALTNIIQHGAALSDWKTWVLPVALAIFGHLTQPTPSK